MVVGQDGHRHSPSPTSGGEGMTAGCFLTSPVAVEAEDRGGGVQTDHSGELARRKLSAGLGDRAEPVGAAGPDGGDGDGHGVEGALDDDDLSLRGDGGGVGW